MSIRPIPRDISDLFRVTYGGEEVFRMELFPAVAANPFVALIRNGTFFR